MSYFQRAQTWINNTSDISAEQLQQAIERTAAEASKIESLETFDQEHLEDLQQTIDLLEQTLFLKLELNPSTATPTTTETAETDAAVTASWDTSSLIADDSEAEPLSPAQKQQALQQLLEQGVIKKGV